MLLIVGEPTQCQYVTGSNFNAHLLSHLRPGANILDILSGSSVAQSHPSNSSSQSTSQSRNKLSATGFARDVGLPRMTVNNEMIQSDKRASYQKQIYRRWLTGDVYAPHDLSGSEQKKWKTAKKRPTSDAFDALGINPINEYKVSQWPFGTCMRPC